MSLKRMVSLPKERQRVVMKDLNGGHACLYGMVL